ncbi:hypothetical protein MZK49_20960 [Ensifer sesbaniae]|uniref:hypothetical protein n=1 Tax=Ensifer sesbaniae TaxID=1214071 RepID=UPI0015688552|nr:hypothetical protein [Ensifer sesbaniae]MCK3779181.1 hypothetical protein [Ensifer sesbaniae]
MFYLVTLFLPVSMKRDRVQSVRTRISKAGICPLQAGFAVKEHGFAILSPITENHACEIGRQFSIRAVDYVACGPCGAKVELTGCLMLEKCSLFRMRCRMSA